MPTLLEYYSLVSYAVGTPGENYTVTFPYLFKNDVHIFVNGDERPKTDLTWTSDTTVQVANTQVNDEIYLRRYTKRDSRHIDFNNAGQLGEDSLNLVTKQLLYLIQELRDGGVAGTDPNAPPGSNGGGGDDSELPSLIDDIITELLQTQIFQDLVALIPLTDINAENAIQQAIDIHNNWSTTQAINTVVEQHTIDLADIGVSLGAIDAQIIDIQNTEITNNQTTATAIAGVASRLDDAEANVITLQQTVTDLDSATALQVTQLQSNIDDNESLILTVEQTLTTADLAISSRIDVLEVEFDNNVVATDARLSSIENTYVDENQAAAIAINEITTTFQSYDWEGLFNQSSYISGIDSRSNANEASIEGVESFLVGVGGDINDPGTWQPGSQAVALAGLQSTVDAQATQISAGAEFRRSMFSRFYPGGDPDGDENDMDVVVAVMENTWRTYADESSAVAVRVDNIELNNQPIFFRVTAPDPRDPEFLAMPWHNVGFPDGSSWFMPVAVGGVAEGHSRWYWLASGQPPPGAETVTFPGIAGRWVRATDIELIAQGVEITQVTQAVNDIENQLVGGSIENTIQAVLGDDISAINETLETWVDAGTGLMYGAWNVRINQYTGGAPVIAGVGLGLQQDPNNPEGGSRSDFVVMADYFSIVKPPNGHVLLDPGDYTTAVVPFIVNTGSVPGEPDVIINGDMFVKNTLSANDGFAGRFTFTELDGNGYPVTRDGNFNATGSRLVLASDTNSFNQGVGGSYFNPGQPFEVWMWAGTGTMSHNNATFYIDTDGNAFFDGEVSAKNISGAVGGATPVAVSTGTVTVPNGSTAWHQVGGEVISNDPGVARDRTGSATVTVAMFGTGAQAGRARLMMSRESGYGTNVWGGWSNVCEYPVSIPLGSSLTLSGTHPNEGSGRFKIKVEIARQEGASGGTYFYPSSNRYDGFIILSS